MEESIMRQDPTEFRERFKRWKAGEKVYDAGTPISGYKEWKNRIKQYKGLDVDNDNTYDYLSYYNNHTDEAWDMLNNSPYAHFYDTYKTAHHPTFSNESIYSGRYDLLHNSKGVVGGRWLENPNRFIPSHSKRDINSIRETADYISVAEPNGLQIRDEQGRWPIIDGAVFGGVLPQVNVVPEYDGGKTPKVNSPEGQQYLLSYKDGSQTKILGKEIKECAEFANAVMNHFGYNVSGDAWHPNQMSLLYSGYDTSNFPSEYNEQAVDLYNK